MVARAGAGLVVLLDDQVAGVRRLRVDSERLDSERPPQRPPLQVAAHDRDRLDLLDPCDLHELALRNASRTIGSIRATPSTRSSRFAVPAQSANACCRTPV